jgi:hypothetical protein
MSNESLALSITAEGADRFRLLVRAAWKTPCRFPVLRLSCDSHVPREDHVADLDVGFALAEQVIAHLEYAT